MASALVCIRCGGPLPATAAGASFATCPYCGTTLHLATDGAASSANAPPAEDAKAAYAKRVESRKQFDATLKSRLEAGDKPYDALSVAARAFGVDGSDSIARATLAIAQDFDEANHAHVSTDAAALARIGEAYLKACEELASVRETTMNLPFLTTEQDGPKHLDRTLVASDLATLAQRAPLVAPIPVSPIPAAPVEKKKGWWPFG